jgi:hypothetical protein
MMYRQLEQTVKATKTLSGDFPSETVAPPASNVPANLEHPVQVQPETPVHLEPTSEAETEASTAWSVPAKGR